jgi:hypothetical protein
LRNPVWPVAYYHMIIQSSKHTGAASAATNILGKP